MMKKYFIGLASILLSCIGTAYATNIGPWSCTDDGIPVCSYAQGDELFQLIPIMTGDAIEVNVIMVGQCQKDASLKFSNGLQLNLKEIDDYGPAKCHYAFDVKNQSMTMMSQALQQSSHITFHAGTKKLTAPITQNDDLVHVMQYWKREQGN